VACRTPQWAGILRISVALSNELHPSPQRNGSEHFSGSPSLQRKMQAIWVCPRAITTTPSTSIRVYPRCLGLVRALAPGLYINRQDCGTTLVQKRGIMKSLIVGVLVASILLWPGCGEPKPSYVECKCGVRCAADTASISYTYCAVVLDTKDHDEAATQACETLVDTIGCNPYTCDCQCTDTEEQCRRD